MIEIEGDADIDMSNALEMIPGSPLQRPTANASEPSATALQKKPTTACRRTGCVKLEPITRPLDQNRE